VRVLIVTDAWYPQINGVVRTLSAMRDEMTRMGDEIYMLTPEEFTSLPCPTYPEIRLAIAGPGAVAQVVQQFLPCAIHIATEGPLGLAARCLCVKRSLPFTTAFHTRFPEYIEARLKIPADWIYPLLRWFHGRSSIVMAPTPLVVRNLSDRGFHNVRLWGRGVDVDLFKPGPKAHVPGEGPVLLYVGRIAVEKNIAAFLDMKAEGTKVVVGDGPMIDELRNKHPEAHFVGSQHGHDLVSYYNAADVFVFPSRTDTFGLVMLEALACGVPVAAFPVMGPKDVITDETAGCLNVDLVIATTTALGLNRADCRAFALQRSWTESANNFRSYLHELEQHLLANTKTKPRVSRRWGKLL